MTNPIYKCVINKNTTITPIWFMRQAGRYLPEFRKIRKLNPNFINLCLNENLSSKITLQPLQRFKLDAAIIFSDILMVPYGLNQEVKFKKNFGPKLGILNLEKKIDLISIAKSEKRNEGSETFYIQKNKKIKFKTNDKTLFFLQRLRDEAHRFAITSHKTRRSKVSKSILDEIEGIGPNKKRDLLKYFGSSEQIKLAQLSEIEKVKGINKNIAKKIYNFFHEN